MKPKDTYNTTHDADSTKQGKNTKDDRPIFDVKFYPYDDPAADPVFAMVTGRDVGPPGSSLWCENI